MVMVDRDSSARKRKLKQKVRAGIKISGNIIPAAVVTSVVKTPISF
jgi:hypothetical protein